MDVAEVLHSLYTVIFQIALIDSIFGRPSTYKGIISQVFYGVIWTTGLYGSGNWSITFLHGNFLP